MSRLSLNVWNEWRGTTREYVDMHLFRGAVSYLRNHWTTADIVLLGFGVSLTWYAKGAQR